MLLKFLRIVSAAVALSALFSWSQTPTPPAEAAKPAAPATTAPLPPPAAGPDSALNQRIERNVRARFKIPQKVQVVIGPRRPSDINGYDTVTVTLVTAEHQSPHDFYLSKDGNTLAQLNKIDISQDPLATANRPTRGAQDAKVTVIVYDDFQCPYCAKGYQTLFNDVLPDYKDKVRVVYKDFPLYEIHPWAIHAAVDANCLFDQSNDAYWDFADYVHSHQSDIRGENKPLPAQFVSLDASALDSGKKFNMDVPRLQACVKAQDEKVVRASQKYGDSALGIDATPTLFINGAKLEGAVPADDLREALNAALHEAGVPAPEKKARVNAAPDAQAAQNAAKSAKPAPQEQEQKQKKDKSAPPPASDPPKH